MMYKILSLDGGGIRGLMTAVILDRLSLACPGWLDEIDLLAGTSTGGIIALGLAKGMVPAEVVNLYYEFGPVVFKDNFFDDIRDVGMLFGANYGNEGLLSKLRDMFGYLTLGKLSKKVLVSSFSLDTVDKYGRRTWTPKIFNNTEGDDLDELVVKVAAKTSAAPVFFPSFENYIDGGVVVNNPSMCAYSLAVKSGISPGDICLLSLGTGDVPRYVDAKYGSGDLGVAFWAKYLLFIMMDGGNKVVDYQCQHLMGSKYYRLSPVLHHVINLDDWKKRDEIMEIGNETPIDGAVEFIKGFIWG